MNRLPKNNVRMCTWHDAQELVETTKFSREKWSFKGCMSGLLHLLDGSPKERENIILMANKSVILHESVIFLAAVFFLLAAEKHSFGHDNVSMIKHVVCDQTCCV